MKKVDIDQVVRNFQKFLVMGWPNVEFSNKLYDCYDDILEEWCQANWELLVE